MMGDKIWMTTSDAARYLGVHVETLRNWARKGVIPAAKLGNRGGFRFRRQELDRFLESRRRPKR
jgi:excisionase family DNA binding protein